MKFGTNKLEWTGYLTNVYQGSLNQMLLLSSGKVRERSEQIFFINPSL